MKFTVLTLFPDLISQYVGEGVIGRAVKRDLAKVDAVDIRDFTTLLTGRAVSEASLRRRRCRELVLEKFVLMCSRF